MEPLLINSREAAKLLGISERTLWELKKMGVIPFVKVGKLVRFRPEALRRWAAAQERSKVAQ